jgi:hypothetical protein
VILARINRAELEDFNALILAHLLMLQFNGQIVVPDFAFMGDSALNFTLGHTKAATE